MAEGKNSFIMYCDNITTVEKLSDEQAGKLMKHLLRYVNDMNPEPPDLITEIAFEPIKRALKRDLISWNETSEKRKEIGRLGGLKSGISRKSKQTKQLLKNGSKTKQNEHVSESVSVSESVIKKSDLILPFKSLEFKTAWETLLTHDKWNKKKIGPLAASLKKLSKMTEVEAIESMENAYESGWQGVYKPKNNGTKNFNNGSSKEFITAEKVGAPGSFDDFGK